MSRLLSLPLALVIIAPAQRPSPDPAVPLARGYFERWTRELAAVVLEEHYTQTLQTAPRGRDFASSRDESTMRRLVSDVLLVRAPRESRWLMFRDVGDVDGAPVHDGRRRFDELFAQPDADLLASARRIADEGARFNLGRVFRNVNTPTTALAFLEPAFSTSVDWEDAKRGTIEGRPSLELEFHQRRAPFVIKTADGDGQPASGRLWIVPGTGQIVAALLDVHTPFRNYARTRIRIESRFGPVPGIEPWVPLRMEEEYATTGRGSEHMRGKAEYSNHRTFQTGARIIGQDRDDRDD